MVVDKGLMYVKRNPRKKTMIVTFFVTAEVAGSNITVITVGRPSAGLKMFRQALSRRRNHERRSDKWE
jgi:hypothetical protein